MLRAAILRLLKARSWAYNPGRLLTKNLMLMQPNNKIFFTILKGKSTLSQPVPHISITPYLDYFENEEVFQTKQEVALLKSKPFDVLALKYAAQHYKSIPQITTDRIDSVAKIEQGKMDVKIILEIIIKAEVPNKDLLDEAYIKTMPQNSNIVHQVDQISQGNIESYKTEDNNGKIALKEACLETMLQNCTDSKDLGSKIDQDNINSNKTTDSKRKAALFNASLHKNAYVEATALNSYRTEPNVKIKQHNMGSKKTVDSKILAEIFNVGLLKETCDKVMLQNPSYSKDSVGKIGQDNMDANSTGDSETKAALFNAILLKEVAVKSMAQSYIIKDPIDHKEQRNKDGKKTENSVSLTDVFNANAHKDTIVKTPQNFYKKEPNADTGHRNMNCNKAVDNKIKTNFNIGEAYVKNIPQNSTNSKDPVCW